MPVMSPPREQRAPAAFSARLALVAGAATRTGPAGTVAAAPHLGQNTPSTDAPQAGQNGIGVPFLEDLQSRQNRLGQRNALVASAGDLREVEGDGDTTLLHAHHALADPHRGVVADR